MENKKSLNRIKIVLVERQKTSKWLAEQLGKGETTISKWCTNRTEPSIETLVQISRVLQVDVKDLLLSTLGESTMVYFKLPGNGLQD